MPTPTKTSIASRKKRTAILGTGAGIVALGGGLATVWPTGSKNLPDTLPAQDTCRVIEVVDGDTLHASCDTSKRSRSASTEGRNRRRGIGQPGQNEHSFA